MTMVEIILSLLSLMFLCQLLLLCLSFLGVLNNNVLWICSAAYFCDVLNR